MVLIRYAGRLLFIPGEESVAFTAPVFETGDPRYQWLNVIQAAGKGIMSADLSRIDYEVCELQQPNPLATWATLQINVSLRRVAARRPLCPDSGI